MAIFRLGATVGLVSDPRRRGTKKAIVAVGRSILVVWYLVSDPDTRFQEFGADYHDTHRPTQRAVHHNHIHQLHKLGYRVALEPAA